MTDKTAFEQWWSHKCAEHGIRDTDSLFKAIGNEAWEAAIDAALNECDNWIEIIRGSCGYGLEDCKEEIQKLRSE